MLNLMLRQFKLLFKKKSIIFSLIILPVALTIAFTFIMGSSMNYGIGIINNDNSIVSEKLIEDLGNISSISTVDMKETDVDSALVGKEIEVAIIFPKELSRDTLDGKNNNIIVKSVSEGEIKSSVLNILNSKLDNYITLGKAAKGDETTFKKLLKEYEDSDITYSLNSEQKQRYMVAASIGVTVMLIFMTNFYVARFAIDDEQKGTKDRVLLGNVSRAQYYSSLFIVFYICSAITSIVYYTLCNILDFDFGTTNPIYYLVLLLSVNFLAIAFNLATVILSKTPAVAANICSLVSIVFCMLGGLLWPFDFMPESIQKIGSIIPMRWIAIAVERIQKNYVFSEILPYIGLILITGIVLLLITVFFSKRVKSAKI